MFMTLAEKSGFYPEIQMSGVDKDLCSNELISALSWNVPQLLARSWHSIFKDEQCYVWSERDEAEALWSWRPEHKTV